MFPRAAAAKIAPGHHDRILAVELAFVHITLRIRRFRQSREGISPQLFVLLRNRRHEIQVLRRDNLIRVYIIPHHKDWSGKNRLHEPNLDDGQPIFNQILTGIYFSNACLDNSSAQRNG